MTRNELMATAQFHRLPFEMHVKEMMRAFIEGQLMSGASFNPTEKFTGSQLAASAQFANNILAELDGIVFAVAVKRRKGLL